GLGGRDRYRSAFWIGDHAGVRGGGVCGGGRIDACVWGRISRPYGTLIFIVRNPPLKRRALSNRPFGAFCAPFAARPPWRARGRSRCALEHGFRRLLPVSLASEG